MVTVLNLCELAIKTALAEQLINTGVKVYVADRDEIKDVMPFCVVHGVTADEQIGPGSGIFKVTVDIEILSHVKEQSPTDRDTIYALVESFAYNNPAALLSTMPGFHCHGFIPASGAMKVDPERKAYIYTATWDVFCMPRSQG